MESIKEIDFLSKSARENLQKAAKDSKKLYRGFDALDDRYAAACASCFKTLVLIVALLG